MLKAAIMLYTEKLHPGEILEHLYPKLKMVVTKIFQNQKLLMISKFAQTEFPFFVQKNSTFESAGVKM